MFVKRSLFFQKQQKVYPSGTKRAIFQNVLKIIATLSIEMHLQTLSIYIFHTFFPQLFLTLDRFIQLKL